MKRLFIILAVLAALAAAAQAGTQASVSSRTVVVSSHASLRPGDRIAAPRFNGRVVRYQWLRCNAAARGCHSIRGATRRSYIVRFADTGHVLRVRADIQGNTSTMSAPTGLVGRPLPVITAVPTITDGGEGGGTLAAPNYDDVLTGTNGTWRHAVRFTYQWDDCDSTGANCVAIAGATANTYTLVDADVGHTIVFVVTAYNF